MAKPEGRIGFKRELAQTLLAGVAVLVPIVVTAYVIWASATWLNSQVVKLVNLVYEPLGTMLSHFQGAGILLLFGVILVVGYFTRFWAFRRGLAIFEWILARIPLVKILYGGLRDLLRFFGGGEKEAMGQVVLFHLPNMNASMLAILTSRSPRGLPAEQARGRVAIFVPMSYQLGGFMLYVPAEAIEPLHLSVEEVLKLAATAEAGVVNKPSAGVSEPGPDEAEPSPQSPRS